MATKENKGKEHLQADAEANDKSQEVASQKKNEQKKIRSLNAKVKQLETTLKEEKDKYLRLSADFDNYRKRTLKEKMDLAKLAGEEIFLKILPVLDDLDRALKSVQDASDLDAVKKGIQLIYSKFTDYLSQQGVKEIEALHQDFNTDLHEAVSQIPPPDKKLKGKVVDVVEKGYYLNDKVIRYSKVIIGE
jgi:molecular chaperone GrpE